MRERRGCGVGEFTDQIVTAFDGHISRNADSDDGQLAIRQNRTAQFESMVQRINSPIKQKSQPLLSFSSPLTQRLLMAASTQYESRLAVLMPKLKKTHKTPAARSTQVCREGLPISPL